MARCRLCDYSNDTPTLNNMEENQHHRRIKISDGEYICEDCEIEINDAIREFEEDSPEGTEDS